MPDNLLNYKTVPFGSLVLLPDDVWPGYIPRILALPKSLQQLLFSPRTGAYIRGLTKTYNIPLEKAPLIALNVLRICLGEKQTVQLTQVLATDLQTAPGITQKMALDLEKDLFASVALDLNRGATKATLPPPTNYSGARNVLDLKKDNPPYPLPPRPR